MEDFITATIESAGKATLELFGSALHPRAKKHVADIVTEADLASQRILVDAIMRAYPSHGIVAEENELRHQENADYVWYLDPLDGTRNFSRRTPLFGVIMGLAHKKEMKHGAIYLPASRELCVAAAGKGAFLNGVKIRCSETSVWEHSYGTGPIKPFSPFGTKLIEGIGRLSHETAWMSALGSIAVSALYVADGRRDWFVSRRAYVWDYAAPSLIMKEAGCTVTNSAGNEWKVGDAGLIAATPLLHPGLLSLVKEQGY